MKTKILSTLIVLSGLFGQINAWAVPAEILIIRHAEKPASGPDLAPAGYARAQALVDFFQKDPRMLDFGLPAAIYASAPDDSAGASSASNRAVETVTPLAQALGMNLNDLYIGTEYAQAAEEILNDPAYEGRMVLICWDHKNIPPLAEALGVQNPPQPWPGNVFDRVWKINYNPAGEVIGFQNLPQHLMPGDSPN